MTYQKKSIAELKEIEEKLLRLQMIAFPIGLKDLVAVRAELLERLREPASVSH